MSKYRKLTHVYYKCDYHIVFTPKYRFRILEGMVKSLVAYDLQMISPWKNVQVQEWNIQSDHIHMICSIPPKLSISEFMGTLKGKIAIKLFKTILA